MRAWQKLIVNALIFVALSAFIPGFYVSSFGVAVGAAVILGLLNIFIRPILTLLSLPVNLLTFGLFSIVINGIMLSLTSAFMGSSFEFSSFGTTLLVAVLMSIINSLIDTRSY